jgi:hypothetical protein
MLMMALLSSASAAAACPPLWSDQFPGGGLDGADALAAVTFDDDGAGPNPPSLFVGGNFTTAGGKIVNHVARFDGERWHPLGQGVGGTVRAMTIFDDDGDGPAPPTLIVGGEFAMAGDVPAALVARWDGERWSALGPGLQMALRALATFDEDGDGPLPSALFAAGAMAESKTGPLFALARWDGRSWSLLGPGTDGLVNALCVFDSDAEGSQSPRLIAGGEFDTIGGVAAARIASWDGSNWSPLGGGVGGNVNALVNALTVYDEDGSGPAQARLIAGGQFTAAGAVAASAIAGWDGAQWAALGTGLHGGLNPPEVFSMTVFDDDGPGLHDPRLIVAGDFNGAGSDLANGLARWNGVVWAALTSNLIGDFTLATVFAPPGVSTLPQLFAGGTIFTPAGLGDDNLYRWNGQALAPLGNGLSNQVDAIAAANDVASDAASEVVYVGGTFIWAGDVPVGRIARWDGESWSALSGGVTGQVLALLAVDVDSDARTPDALYAGGFFTMASGIEVNRIARWDGRDWSALGAGMTLGGPVIGAASVRALAARDSDGQGPAVPQLYVGGEFSFAGSTLAKNVARWNGSQWFALGAGVNDVVAALALFDEDGDEATLSALFAGGEFGMAGGSPAGFIARWNNGSWSPVAGGVDGPVRALLVFDGDDDGPQPPALIVGGLFGRAGAAQALNIARWDGRDWSALGDGLSDEVSALAAADFDGDGAQPLRLVAGGKFMHSGSVPLNHAGLWDGREWSPLGAGADGTVLTVAAVRDFRVDPSRQAVLLGGTFQSAGGLSADRIARWGCAVDEAVGCAGDVSGDGIVNGIDLALLLASWGACPARGGCPTDLDGNGLTNGIDLAILLAAWGSC